MVASPDGFPSLAEILATQRTVLPPELSPPATKVESSPKPRLVEPDTSRYELNLAEFPFFVLAKRANRLRELIVTGTYKDPHTGDQVPFAWHVQPSLHGLPGPFEQDVFFALMQLWWEQGTSSPLITYGSIYALLRRMGVSRNPSQRDYQRVVRAFERLVGATIKTTNCFYDAQTKQRVSLLWHPFTKVFYYPDEFKSRQRGQMLLPFAAIQVDELFLDIARKNGFLQLNFTPDYFYALAPLQKRYALYLSKLLRLQAVHVKSLDDLVKLGPIETSRPRRARQTLRNTFDDLLDRKLPYFARYDTFQSNGVEYFRFFSARSPRSRKPPLSPQEEFALERITQAVGGDQYRNLWLTYLRRHGVGVVDRALGLLSDSVAAYKKRGLRYNAGKLLRTIFERDLAAPSANPPPPTSAQPLTNTERSELLARLVPYHQRSFTARSGRRYQVTEGGLENASDNTLRPWSDLRTHEIRTVLQRLQEQNSA